MTTYTIQGVGVDFMEVGNEANSIVPNVALTFTILDGALTFSYSVEMAVANSFDEIILNLPALSANIDGNSILVNNPADETTFGVVEWDDNGTTRTSYVLDLFIASSDLNFLFVVGGDAFPTFASTAEFNDFVANDVTGLGPVTSGPFAPGQNIPFANIPGIMTTENDIINGTSGDDTLDGGAGNDTITPGDNNGLDQLFGSTGNDQYIFTGISGGDDYYELDYSNLGNGITLNVDGTANTGSVNKGASGIDTITDVNNVLSAGWFDGGIRWTGTGFNDIFNITTGNEQWNQVYGGGGNDTFNITRTGTGFTRLDYSKAAAGINADLSTGVVSDDGDGGMDTINGQIRELRGSNYDDVIVGSNADESFIGRTGTDSIDGGGGFDRIRYDRSGVDSGITADLAAGTITGSWFGQGFTHNVSNIEQVRGSKFNDVMTANASGSNFDARDGDDTLIGGSGGDTLNGGNDNDTITPGENTGTNTGDILIGSSGNDEYIFTGVVGGDSYYELNYQNLSTGIVLTINGDTNTGSVVKGLNGTDTITDVSAPLNTGWINGGIIWVGTVFNDIFNITTGTDQWNQVYGGAGNDTFNITRNGTGVTRIDYSRAAGGIDVDLAMGTASDDGDGGVDTILGDVWEIRGSDFADTIVGSDADESFISRAGNDTIDGGDGFDRIRYDRSGVDSVVNVNLETGTATGTWFGTGFTDTLSNLEWVRGTNVGGDTIVGNELDNFIEGMDGDDTLSGGVGIDTIHGGRDNDTINGNDGDDILNGDQGDDIINGGADNDTLDGGAGQGNDTINGGSGNDIIDGRNGTDVLSGGSGNDTINGQNKNDVLSGNTGEDILNGNQGNDTLLGGNDNDMLFGGAAADTLNGQDGDDQLFGGGQSDVLNGGRNNDMLDGGSGNDRLSGGSGLDELFGGSGTDVLNGNSGADELRGGSGNDTLTGGSDAGDIFIFDSADAGSDRILDFQDGLDMLRFTGGISAGDITVSDAGSSGQNARIEIAGVGITIIINDIDHNLIDTNDFMFV